MDQRKFNRGKTVSVLRSFGICDAVQTTTDAKDSIQKLLDWVQSAIDYFRLLDNVIQQISWKLIQSIRSAETDTDSIELSEIYTCNSESVEYDIDRANIIRTYKHHNKYAKIPILQTYKFLHPESWTTASNIRFCVHSGACVVFYGSDFASVEFLFECLNPFKRTLHIGRLLKHQPRLIW